MTCQDELKLNFLFLQLYIDTMQMGEGSIVIKVTAPPKMLRMRLTMEIVLSRQGSVLLDCLLLLLLLSLCTVCTHSAKHGRTFHNFMGSKLLYVRHEQTVGPTLHSL